MKLISLNIAQSLKPQKVVHIDSETKKQCLEIMDEVFSEAYKDNITSLIVCYQERSSGDYVTISSKCKNRNALAGMLIEAGFVRLQKLDRY